MRSMSWLMVPAVVVMVGVAEAAETGAVRGKVKDADGLAVPGATVTLSGPNIAGELTVTASDDGEFRLVNIPPGQHELTVSAQGFAPVKYTVNVRLDETTFVPVQLKPAETASEVMVVEESLPVIDATRSTVSTSMSTDLLQNVPTGRSFQAAVNMVPGVYGRVDTQNGGPGNGNPSVRGEGSYGNNYLIDGISTRDPATKTFGTDVNFDAIQEVQVYTDGLPAEFGQATGMLVNVVTKDGGDEHHGSAAYYANKSAGTGQYDILNLETGEEEPTDKRDFFNHELSLTAGGPIKQEKLWYFVAADLGKSNIQFEAMDPDAPYSSWSGQGFAKFTYFATTDLTLQYQFGYGTSQAQNIETSGLYTADAQGRYKSSDLTNIFTATWRPSESNVLELKLSSLNSDIVTEPMSGDTDTPMIYDIDAGVNTNNYDSVDTNKRSRTGGSLKFTQLVNNVLGDHEFKLGTEYWVLKDSRELLFTGPGGTYTDADGNEYEYQGVEYWEYDGDPSTMSCTADNDYADCYGFIHYTAAGELGHEGDVFTGFIQDDWNPLDPLTLNLGFRMDRETLYQNAGDRILSQWMPAPRLGLAWDITNDSKTVFTVNAGRYYDINGNTFADWGDTRSAFVYRQWESDGAGGYVNTWTQDPESDPLIYCTADSLDRYKASLQEMVDAGEYTQDDADALYQTAQDACGDTELKPYHMDKLVVGIEREIVPKLAIGLKGIVSKTRDLPEDIDYDLDTWVITNPANKLRDYRALELTLERQYDGVWQALASYTLSEAMGTSPGQFETSSGSDWGSNGNGVGVYRDDVDDPDTRQAFFDAGYGWLLDGLAGLGREDDDAGWYGYLPYHSFHQVKVAGSYTAPFGTTFGAVYEFDSGHAWQKRGMVDLYGDYYAFPEGRGSRFMPPVHYFDLRVAHTLDLGHDRSAELSLDVFNVLDLEAPITYYENDNEMFGKTMYRQSPRAIRAGAKFTY